MSEVEVDEVLRLCREMSMQCKFEVGDIQNSP